ncbi:hypothetical protein NEOKW01_0274 [Nematocida sp. AWRm80]|nr:hypothetical protein NEOKW01_0274 [Nematocida sp. AWRm80]
MFPRSIASSDALYFSPSSSILEMEGKEPAHFGLPNLSSGFGIPIVKKIFSGCPMPECPLNSSEEHPLIFYSNALYCIIKHGLRIDIDDGGMVGICAFERLILKGIEHGTPVKIDYESIDLTCEQDIESLAYKIFLLLLEKNKNALGHTALCSVLQLLYHRKEYERMYNLYLKCNQHTIRIYKLLLLGTLKTKTITYQSILQGFKDYLSLPKEIDDNKPPANNPWDDMIIKDNPHEIQLKDLNIQDRTEVYHALKSWFTKEFKESYWEHSLEQWKQSQEIEGSSEAMITLCIKMRKYEEGWSVYKESTTETNLCTLRLFRLTSRILSLIIKAINFYGVYSWIERYLEVSTVISRLNIDPVLKVQTTYSCLHDITSYDHVCCIAGFVIKQYPPEIFASRPMCFLLEDTHRILDDHQDEIDKELNNGLMPQLVKSVFWIYSEWKTRTHRNSLMAIFFGRSSDTVSVYGLVLSIGVRLRLECQVKLVCQDIWDNSISVSPPIAHSLEQVHIEICSCTDFCQNSIQSRSYLFHVLSLI